MPYTNKLSPNQIDVLESIAELAVPAYASDYHKGSLSALANHGLIEYRLVRAPGAKYSNTVVQLTPFGRQFAERWAMIVDE